MPAKPYRFFLLTARDPAGDFRLPLAKSLRQHGRTYYIWLRRRPIVIDPNGNRQEMSVAGFIRTMLRLEHGSTTDIYINSTNTSFPVFTALLKSLLPAGIWCLDMHDDLRYDYRGLKRVKTIIAIRLMRLFSDLTFHAAPALRELFPDSRHLGNASDLGKIERPDASADDLLVLASFDRRFDFDLMRQVAARRPDLTFHLYGQVSQNDPEIRAELEALTARHKNIMYRGAYRLTDLPELLARYRTGFAPYAVSGLTHYIDPLRFYHCLNSGMDVITTPIPQALTLQNYLYVARDADGFSAAFDAIASGNGKSAAYAPITWDRRVKELIAMLDDLPKTARL